MMMRNAMSRKAATTGGFTTSMIVHGGLLLLVFLFMRMGPAGVEEVMDELTEIAYIEARYGEDVAKQVRLKTKPKPIVQERNALARRKSRAATVPASGFGAQAAGSSVKSEAAIRIQ